jgi:hypothetical protein
MNDRNRSGESPPISWGESEARQPCRAHVVQEPVQVNGGVEGYAWMRSEYQSSNGGPGGIRTPTKGL